MKLRRNGKNDDADDEESFERDDALGEVDLEEDDPLSPEGTPWRYRNPQAFKRLLAAGGICFVAAIAFVVIVLRPLDTTPDKVRDALASSRSVVLDIAVLTNSSVKLKEIRAAGRTAELQLPVIDASIQAVNATNDPHYIRPAVAVLNAERSYLEAFAELQGMGDRKLKIWRTSRKDATIEQKKIGLVRPLITELDVAEIDTVVPTSRQLEVPMEHLDDTIKAAARKIGPWLRRLYAAQMRQKAEISAYAQYGGQVRAGDKQYQALRDDTQRWTAEVDQYGSTYQAAYEYLAGAHEARVQLRDQLSATSAPPGVQPSQDSLVSILGESISLIESAGQGLGEEMVGTEDDYRQSAGWQNFQSGSDSITSSWPSTMAEWSAALDAAIRSVKSRSMPKRPDV